MQITSLKGRLLVATSDMIDPNFFRTVVLLLEHGPQGSLGLVLNRPTAIGLREPLPRWSEFASAPAEFFRGGPVDPSAVIGMARAEGLSEERWSPLLEDIGVVDLRSDPADSGAAIKGLRVFRGYSGWAATQLEGELSAGGWLVTEPAPDDVFTKAPDALWHRAIRRRPRGPNWIAMHRRPPLPN